MATIVDTYYGIINFHPRVLVTKHVIERAIQRGVDIEVLVEIVKIIQNNICEIIFDTVKNGTSVRITHKGVKVPVKFDDLQMRLVLTTIY